VVLRGITMSRFEDGKIVEDWGYTDSLSCCASSAYYARSGSGSNSRPVA
jgi:hypothetical protein